MQINRIKPDIYTTRPNNHYKKNSNRQSAAMTVGYSTAKYPFDFTHISFKANNNIKFRKINEQAETKKLLKQFDEILASDMDIEELLRMYERQVVAQMQQKQQRAQELLDAADFIADSKHLTDLQKAEKIQSLKKEFNTLEKNLFKIKPFVIPKPVAPEVDNALIRKFQTAIKEDNFNLDKIFLDFYSDLENIKTVDELNKKYPKINTPSDPAFVIADKIEDMLTRDFYENLDRLMRKKNEQKIYDFVTGKIKDIITESTDNPQEIYAQVAIPASMRILDKYEKLRNTNAFASVAQFRKNKTLKITENDKKLLSVDYDDFVLYVIKEQYLNNKKPNEIKYVKDGVSIPVSSLKEPYYKFEKVPERIKSIINTAKTILAAKRDYENFDETKLRQCLNKHAGSETGNNEKIFERIIAFDSCNFESEDKKSLIKFLRLLDSVQDKEISELKAQEIIEKENISPHETEKLNRLEKQKVIEELKNQQRLNQELNFIKTEFDKAINVLYQNELGSTAGACFKYRPDSLDRETVEKAKFIIDLTSQIDKIGKDSIKNTIQNWDTYNYYKENEYDSGLFAQAKEYAHKADGSTDINKAGIYLDSAGIILNVPQSLEYIPYKDIVEGIIDKSDSQEDAIKYLSKYREYLQLNDSEKSHLLVFVDSFNPKNQVDKFILKNIIENDYVNSDTTSKVKLNDNDSVDVTITARAKQQIMDKYMFPHCVDFMADFEKAMTVIAADKGTPGIKRITKNNKAIEYKMEIKLINHDDRLFASQKDYYFDLFSDKGLH